MDEYKSQVYARIDGAGRIIAIDGGYTISNIKDFTDWTLIDEGNGDKYNLCQSNYLPGPIMDERGIYRYEYVDGEVVERSAAAMDADWHEPIYEPTQLDRIQAQTMWTALMTDTLLEGDEF